MSTLIVEISGTNGANVPVPRTFPAKGDKPARTVYEQFAYIHKGGAFPTEIKLTHENHNDAYAIGKYQIAASSFKANQYGQLELDRFNLRLVPYADFNDKK